MVPFQAVIFDLDGTLADSLDDIAEAMNSTLRSHRLPAHPRDVYKGFVGDGVEWLVRRALPEDCPLPLPQLVSEYRAAYAAVDHQKTLPYGGVPELLDALTVLGIPMAVLSNKRDDFTRQLVRKRFGRWRFAAVAGERDGVPRKPDPTAALQVAGVLGHPPPHIVFVGDTPIDMNTARNAGMIPVGVSWGFRSSAELEAAGARRVLSRPQDLLELPHRQ